ncbi:MAG: uroporphyrinogen-III synthase [Caulobacteraceae bacterium]
MKKVWVTRARPGAGGTARRLAARGFEPVVAPLLEVREFEVAVDLTGVGALAFTSAAGVRAFARRSAERSLTVFAVGDATARAARAAGFAEVASARGAVGDLAALIAARGGEFTGEVLHPSAAELAGSLAGARAVAVYETRPAALPALLDRASLHAVLLHSPKAARLLAGILRSSPVSDLMAVCLSRAVAAPLAPLPLEVRIAAKPHEEALLDLLGPPL